MEGWDDADAKRRIAEVKRLCAEHGSEIAANVPEVVRAMPFAPFHNVLGPKGERWVPFHVQLPHSAVLPFHEALGDYLKARADLFAEREITTGAMFMAVGPSIFLYEPTFYWPGARHIYHERIVEPKHLEALPTYDHDEDTQAAVLRMRGEIIQLMHEHGGTHYQIGRVYPYLQDHDEAHLAAVRALKAELDPAGILNPGALGL